MKLKILIITLFVLGVSPIMAQVEKGDVMLTVNGSYTKTGDLGTNGLVFAKLGRFMTKNIELGVKPQVQFGTGYSGVGLGLYGTYNFFTANAKLLPYVGVEFSNLSQSYDEGGDFSSNDAGFYGGTKLFLTEALNVDFGLSVLTNVNNSEDIELGTTFMFNIGVGFVFGKLK